MDVREVYFYGWNAVAEMASLKVTLAWVEAAAFKTTTPNLPGACRIAEVRPEMDRLDFSSTPSSPA